MNSPASPRGFRQQRCGGCGLNPEACICTLFGRLDCPMSIRVVMSRAEARSASNSARLLALWLPNVSIIVRGEEGASDGAEPLVALPDTALLFPGGGRARPLPSGVRHLIVPDGTWAQARRIERRCFAPHGLPKVELEGPWPSLYELRRGREGLCTFEATAIALGLLEAPSLGATLLARFGEWTRRAQLLKAGGAPVAPAAVLEMPLAEHPAAALLRAMPPGTGDAARAR